MHTDIMLEKVFKIVPKIRTYSTFCARICPPPILKEGTFDCVKEAKSDHFTMGFGKFPLVPEDILRKKYYMAGYHLNNPITAVQDPTYARAVWIDDNSGKGGIVLVSVDCIGLLSPDVNNIRKILSGFCERTGCRAINIVSTHNHAAIDTMGLWGKLPKSGRDRHFIKDVLYKGITHAVELAYSDKRDGDLMLGRCEGEGIQHDIRIPEVFSKTITRLRFVPYDGKRCIHIINFAAHAETMDCHNSVMSADWPGFMCSRIFEQTLGDETVFLNGALGGMITPVEKGKNNVETTIIAGVSVADASLGIKDEIKLTPKIGIIRQEFYIPLHNLLLTAAGLIKIMPSKKIKTGGGTLGLSLKSELNFIEIGNNLQILMVPGELFPELAYGGYLPEETAANGSPDTNPKPLIEIAQNPELVIVGLANDEIGYILPPNDFILDDKKPYIEDAYDKTGRKHYEETNSTGIDTARCIADTFEAILKTIRESKK